MNDNPSTDSATTASSAGFPGPLPPLPDGASPLRRALRLFALDGWFRIVSFPGGEPDRRALWRHGAFSLAWFLAGCLAFAGGYYLFWPVFLLVAVAAWKTLWHWSRTFYAKRPGGNRWLFSDYARAFAGFVRVFAALWTVYLATTPLRPFSAEPPPADVLALVDAARAADPGYVETVERSLGPESFYAITQNATPGVLGPGVSQILHDPFSSFLFGDDHAAQRRIAEARRAWSVAILCTPVSGRAAIRDRAMRADLAHPVLGRGGLPHLCDHWVFGPRHPLVTSAEK